jgi:hypothetical protein
MKLILEERVSRFDAIKTWLLRTGIGILFIVIGQSKFAAHSEWIKIFAQIGLGHWFRYFTGCLQMLGGVLVLIPRTFAFGILIIACTMAGAVAAWIFLLGEPFLAFIPGALLLGLMFVGGEGIIGLVDTVRKR